MEKNDILKDYEQQYKCLFPDDTLHQEILISNQKMPINMFKMIIIFSIILVTTITISFSISEPISYILANTIFFIVMPMIGFFTIKIYKSKSIIFKNQYKKLLLEEEKYKMQIILHQQLQKFDKRWNIIFASCLIFISILSVLLFIGDLIESKTSYAPILLFFMGSILFIIPLFIGFFIDLKKCRKKAREIEKKILFDNSNA